MPIVVKAFPRKDYGSRVSNQLIPQSPNKDPVLVPSPLDLESSDSWGGLREGPKLISTSPRFRMTAPVE